MSNAPVESDSLWTIVSNWIATGLLLVVGWLIKDFLGLRTRVTTLETMRKDARQMHLQEQKHRDDQHDSLIKHLDDMSDRIKSIEVHLRDAG